MSPYRVSDRNSCQGPAASSGWHQTTGSSRSKNTGVRRCRPPAQRPPCCQRAWPTARRNSPEYRRIYFPCWSQRQPPADLREQFLQRKYLPQSWRHSAAHPWRKPWSANKDQYSRRPECKPHPQPHQSKYREIMSWPQPRKAIGIPPQNFLPAPLIAESRSTAPGSKQGAVNPLSSTKSPARFPPPGGQKPQPNFASIA